MGPAWEPGNREFMEEGAIAGRARAGARPGLRPAAHWRLGQVTERGGWLWPSWSPWAAMRCCGAGIVAQKAPG